VIKLICTMREGAKVARTLAGAVLYALCLASVPAATSDQNNVGKGSLVVPAGTILPVRLNSTISSANSRAGQVITARVMQAVPLASGAEIKAGSKLVGHVVDVTPANAGTPPQISLQFDKLIAGHQIVTVTTNLRAMAGFMRISEAQTPPIGPGESDVYEWLPTVQGGGDVVYGQGGPVMSENGQDVVGKEVNGGVLGQVRAKAGTKCRGAIDGNTSPQALWVFSSDACGTYGLDHVSIMHAGRTDRAGVIVLISDEGKVKVRSGTGMLLRINASVSGN
jgi:hypothetical protein